MLKLLNLRVARTSLKHVRHASSSDGRGALFACAALREKAAAQAPSANPELASARAAKNTQGNHILRSGSSGGAELEPVRDFQDATERGLDNLERGLADLERGLSDLERERANFKRELSDLERERANFERELADLEQETQEVQHTYRALLAVEEMERRPRYELWTARLIGHETLPIGHKMSRRLLLSKLRDNTSRHDAESFILLYRRDAVAWRALGKRRQILMGLLDSIEADQWPERTVLMEDTGRLLYKLIKGEQTLREGGVDEDAAALAGMTELVLAVLGRQRAAAAFDYAMRMPYRPAVFRRYARDPELVDWDALSPKARKFFK